MAASITASRFAVLNIEGSDDEKKKKGKGQSDYQKAKKNKKKPKSADQSNLRSLAFGSGKSAHGGNKSSGKAATPSEQLEEWHQRDQEIVEDMYEQQLQQAILASRIEQEQKLSAGRCADGSADGSDNAEPEQDASTASQDNKKKRKKKKKTLTIAEFQRDDSPQNEPERLQAEQNVKISETSENFFEAVDSSAAKLIKKDKMQDEYTKQYKVQAVLNAKHSAELEERDNVIADLRNKLLEAQVEVQQVKKRNKQLCYMLAQGEMKDKSEILQQVHSLTSLKNELTSQLSTMSMEMEKERSKVHSLQNELAKAKAKVK